MTTCPLCSKAFTSARRPRILLCYHTFCTTCLEALYQDDTGIISCPQCANEERYNSVQSVPIDLALVQEGEEDTGLQQGHQLLNFLRELQPLEFFPNTIATEPIAWPKVPMPHKMTCKAVHVNLPQPLSFPYTTRIEYQTDGRLWMPYFNVTYYKSKTTRLFRTSGDFYCDRMEFWARDPKHKDIGGATGKISPSGLLEEVLQVLAIIEDQTVYEVFLDGIMMASLEKIKPDEDMSLCRQIKIEGFQIMIQNFAVFKNRIPY